MQTLMHIIDIILPIFVFIIRFPFWIVHFAFLLVVRIVLLVILLGSIIIPCVIAIVLITMLPPMMWQPSDPGPNLDSVLTFFAGFGIFAALITFFRKAIIDSLSTIGQNCLKALSNEWIQWMPELKIVEGLLTTKKQIADTRQKIRETFSSSKTFAFSVFIGWIVVTLLYRHVAGSIAWQQNVTKGLETLEKRLEALEEQQTELAASCTEPRREGEVRHE